jgi:hypothetical protein
MITGTPPSWLISLKIPLLFCITRMSPLKSTTSKLIIRHSPNSNSAPTILTSWSFAST